MIKLLPYNLIAWLLILVACRQPGAASPAPTITTSVSSAPTVAAPAALPATLTTIPTAGTTATATRPHLPTALATPTPTATSTATPDPYQQFTISGLAARAYGGGVLEQQQRLAVTESFTRTLVAYPSDGLSIFGFMNVPFGPGPFPVALVLHGYIPPSQYGTIAYTTRYADALARAGYLVIHPNYRNHPPSDQTDDFADGRATGDYRVGYAVDVLNLIAIVEEQAGRPGPLARARVDTMHLLGHSMGGGIALRVATVAPGTVDAVALYGSMSGDEYQNYERILMWSGGETGEAELATPPETMERISPIYHLDRITAAVSIHHGTADDVVPPAWSADLCQRLDSLGKDVDCFTYEGAPHTFHDATDRLFQQRVVDFFDRY